MNRRELVEMMDQVAGEIITRGDYIQVLKWFRRISVATGIGIAVTGDFDADSTMVALVLSSINVFLMSADKLFNGFKIAVLEDELKYLCSMLFSVNEEDNIHRVLKG